MTSPAINEAVEKFRELEQKIQEFFDGVNEVMSWIPDFLTYLIEPVKEGMEWVQRKVKEFWDRVNELLANRGDSVRLHEVAREWAENVGNRVNDIAGSINLDKMQTNLDWEGRGAESYKETVPAQGAGLEAIKGLADQLRSSMDNLGNGIDSFWIAIKIATVAFIIGIVAAIVSIFVPVTVPVGIGAFLAAAGAAIALIATTIISLKTLMDGISTEQNNILQKIHDLGGAWDRSNTSTMQQKSDWHTRQ